MELNITARHFEVTDELKKFTEKKFKKLDRYKHLVVRTDLIVSDEKGLKVAEGKIAARGNFLVAKTSSHDIYLAIDELADKLLKQLKTFDSKLKSKKRA
ncbi:MAG: ribosome-associated translation inhibitor RaiA [candidate division WOR-3 bacterium]